MTTIEDLERSQRLYEKTRRIYFSDVADRLIEYMQGYSHALEEIIKNENISEETKQRLEMQRNNLESELRKRT